MTDRPKLITSDKFGQALIDAGVISRDDSVSRIVIDAKIGDIVRLYLERNGDERLLSVATTLEGIEIRGVPA